MQTMLSITPRVLLAVLSFCLYSSPAMAHHGGLGIEGDLVQWALKTDQWQEEIIDQGYRMKFLAYPRQPLLGKPTRLVFEIQAVATGRYVSGLKAQLHTLAPDGTRQEIALPEIAGVTAYYETLLTFTQVGEHTVTFVASAAETVFRGTFRKAVSPSSWRGDWPTVVGNSIVLAASIVTWLGLILSVQRRFTPLHS
jgi:hypothetical protein